MFVRLGTFECVDVYLVAAVTNHTYRDLFLSQVSVNFFNKKHKHKKRTYISSNLGKSLLKAICSS